MVVGRLAILAIVAFSALGEFRCEQALDASPSVIRLASYNLMHFTESRDVAGSRYWSRGENVAQKTAEILLGIGADIYALQEVGSLTTLQSFNERYLRGAFKVSLSHGHSPKMMHTGLLIRKSFPWTTEFRHHRNERVGGAWVFPRSIPAVILREKGKTHPILVVLGIHFKCPKPSGPDPDSALFRMTQALALSRIIQNYRLEFGSKTRIVAMGDFNGDVKNSFLYEALGEMKNVFDLTPAPLAHVDRVTHNYCPDERTHIAQQLDYILVVDHMAEQILQAGVYRSAEPKVSDHDPVYADLRLGGIQ